MESRRNGPQLSSRHDDDDDDDSYRTRISVKAAIEVLRAMSYGRDKFLHAVISYRQAGASRAMKRKALHG